VIRLIIRTYREFKKVNSQKINDQVNWTELFQRKKSKWLKITEKKWSPSLAINKMQIKTTLRFHLTPVRMVTIKNTNKKCWQGCGEKGTLIHWWRECKLTQPLWKTVWRLLKKVKIDLPYDPAIPFLGIYPKECDSGYNKGTCYLL
jgi:hypothetical protein